jgi:AraC-like DNA-binding protein
MALVHEGTENDVIRDLLGALRLSATVLSHQNYCGSWNLSTAGSRKCAFHLVTRGSCWLHVETGSPMRLEAGDIAVFARDAWHNLSGSPAPAASALAQGDVDITCGYFEFAEAKRNAVLDALPDVLVVRGSESGAMAGIIQLFAGEAQTMQPGSGFVLDKLAEALFAMVLRAHLRSAEKKNGFLAALADPRIGRALTALHREPNGEWHVHSLAAEAGMSRTTFAASFAELVGAPPMQYLAEWRMRRAAALLRNPRNSVGAVAAQLGYRSEAAFRRAFKRRQGFAPGVLRREAKP